MSAFVGGFLFLGEGEKGGENVLLFFLLPPSPGEELIFDHAVSFINYL